MTYKAQCPVCKRVRMTTDSLEAVARWLAEGLIVSAVFEDVVKGSNDCQFCKGER